MTIAVIVDDFTHDPVAHTLQQLCDDVEVVSLARLLGDAGFGFDTEQGAMAHRPAPRPAYLAAPGSVLVDRVIEVSGQTVVLVAGQDGGASRGQVVDCYRSVLDQAPQCRQTAMQYSTAGRLLPLFSQWRLVERLAGVHTPGYRYGYGPEPVGTEGLRRPVFKSPFDLYGWRPNQRPEGIVWDSFVVDVPAGRPAVSYYMGDRVASAWLGSQAADTPPDSAAMVERTLRIGALFGATMGEVLWFVDDERITFAAFSHAMYAAARTPSFAASCQSFVQDLRADAGRLDAEAACAAAA